MSTLKKHLNRHRQSGQTMRTIKMRAHLNAYALFATIREDFGKVLDHRAANASIPLGLFVVSSGFEELLDRRSQQVDDADERVIVSVSPGPAFGGLEDAVERFEASVAVA